MLRKYVWLPALLVIASLVLTACPTAAPAQPAAPAEQAAPTEAPKEEATAAPAEEAAPTGDCALATEGPLAGVEPSGQTVVWWHNHSGSREEKLKALLGEFNAGNPCNISIDPQNQGSYNDIRDKVNASIAAGEQPAALVVGYQNDQAFYQLNEGLADLNTFVDDAHWGLTAEEKADFYASFFNQSVHVLFDNQRLGFPPNRSMEVLYYNATWLKELGYDAPPATPEQFKEMACKAAQSNGSKGYILRDDASAVASWTYAFGGDVLTEDGTQYVYNSQATIDAMTLLKSMYDEGCANFLDDPEGFPNSEFAARKAIFAQGSSSGIPFYIGDVTKAAEEAGKEADEWGVAAIPHTTADPVQNIYGGDVMITATSPEQQLAAWLFIKWFTSPEIQAKWDEASGYFPTRASTTQFLGDYLAANTQWAQAVELLPYAYYEPQLISYTGVRDAATEAFNQIIQGAEIKATLDKLTEDANKMQEELMAEVQ
jgi:multiple sugar transport system substrate-binding protein/sn-glycerol 3-phosphate transport system substrate-binding protein